MGVSVAIRNESVRKRAVRRDSIERLAQRVCTGEGVAGDVEISVLLCDDAAIAELNRRYAGESGPTDVLSFEQPVARGAKTRAIGDIVISLETAERNCGPGAARLRAEVAMLFCHGLLHLLGYDHSTVRGRGVMQHKQAEYLGVAQALAWNFGQKMNQDRRERAASAPGGSRRIGR
jgi:probable rRNA maturation factor